MISFVIPMVLLILMLTLKPASAATLELGGEPPSASLSVLEIAEPDEEEASEEEAEQSRECAEDEPEGEESDEEEAGQDEPEEGEDAGSGSVEDGAEADEPESGEAAETCAGKKRTRVPPARCLLRSARARLFAYASRDRVRLVIRYTTFAPASVAVNFRLGGGRGAQKLGTATRRFAASGLFRVTEKLSRKKMAQVLGARRFTVTMGIAAAPQFCRRFYTRHLTVRRTVDGQTVWYQSDSAFGTRSR